MQCITCDSRVQWKNLAPVGLANPNFQISRKIFGSTISNILNDIVSNIDENYLANTDHNKLIERLTVTHM